MLPKVSKQVDYQEGAKLYAAGEGEKAVQALRKAKDLAVAQSLADLVETVMAQKKLVAEATAKQDYAQAMRAIRTIQAKEQDKDNAYRKWADAEYEKLARPPRNSRRLREERPGVAEGGTARRRDQDAAKVLDARKCFKQALEIYPDSAEADQGTQAIMRKAYQLYGQARAFARMGPDAQKDAADNIKKLQSILLPDDDYYKKAEEFKGTVGLYDGQ